MTVPVWMLLAFAVWTLLLLLGTIGVYRWSRILAGKAPIGSFRADLVEGADWYVRAMRAHANCVENLPVFAAIVLALHAGNVATPLIDALAIIIVIARVLQSLTHVCFVQSDRVVAVRFLFFFAQIVCFLWLAAIIAFAYAMTA